MSAPRAEWAEKACAAAPQILAKYARVEDALPELSRLCGRPVSANALRAAMRQRAMALPTTMLRGTASEAAAAPPGGGADAEAESPDFLSSLRQWANVAEKRVIDAVLKHGTREVAAYALGMSIERLTQLLTETKARAARNGFSPEHDYTHAQPHGFHVKGVSTLYGADGAVKQQWVKSKKDDEDRLEALRLAVQGITEPFRGASEIVQPPAVCDADLLTVYPMGDPHLGMLSWYLETGEDFDLQIAESTLVQAVDHLVALAPASEEALIINLGDFFHADNQSNRTARSGHQLDVDSRWSKTLRVGLRTMRRCIDRTLEKHSRVRVICEIGNHDDHSSIMLGLCLEQFYENNPRVTVDTSPSKFHWHRFGSNLIGVTHGDTCKKDQLPGIMADDRAQDWGETKHRYWYTGHVHHDSVKEYPGVMVETFRTLAPRDAWHAAAGYRSGRDMKADVIHRTRGRINRHIVGVEELRSAA